jgi:hypothetical protein
MIRKSAIVMLAVLATACSSLWNWGNQGALIGGMVEVLSLSRSPPIISNAK